MDDPVELKTAYHWHCERCSAENFALPQKAEMTKQDAEEAYRHFHGLEDWEELPLRWDEVELVQIPDTVKCTECGGEFLTMDESDA